MFAAEHFVTSIILRSQRQLLILVRSSSVIWPLIRLTEEKVGIGRVNVMQPEIPYIYSPLSWSFTDLSQMQVLFFWPKAADFVALINSQNLSTKATSEETRVSEGEDEEEKSLPALLYSIAVSVFVFIFVELDKPNNNLMMRRAGLSKYLLCRKKTVANTRPIPSRCKYRRHPQ